MPDAPLTGAVFIAVGEDGLRTFSRDGRKWTHRQTGKDGEMYVSVCFGNGRCAVGGRYGGDNIFAATDGGVAWQPTKSDAEYANFVRAMVFFGKRFIAIGGDGGASKLFIIPSTDGVKWEPQQTMSGKHLLRRFAQSGDLLVGIGDYGRRGASRDAIQWKDAKDYKPVDALIDVAFGAGVFVGGGLHGLRMRSIDGIEWTDRVVGEEGEHINAMIFDGKQFHGIGQGATYVSSDGKKWDRTVNTNAPTAAAFGGGVFVGSLWPGRMLRSIDAVHWAEVVKLPKHVESLAFGELGAV